MIHSAEQTTSCRVLFSTVPVPGSDVPHQGAPDGSGVEIPQYLRGYPEFPQVSEVKQVSASPSSLQSQYAAPRSGPL